MEKTLSKPSPDYPLTPHSQGYYCKRILGKLHYFGTRWGCPWEALRDYDFKRSYLEEGLEPPRLGTGMPLLEALDRFLVVQEKRVSSRTLSKGSWEDYKTACKQILATISGQRPITSLLQTDFNRVRASLHGTPKTIECYVARIKAALHWVEEHQNVKFNYGDLRKPSAREIRTHRNLQPKKLFAPTELQGLIDSAGPQLKAMTLLGINVGFGNTDCGTLTIDRIKGNWHSHPRPKTGIERRAHLWPETVAALQAVIGDRTKGFVFITKYGNPWSNDGRSSPIAAEFRKLADNLNCSRTFYDLRRTFQTIADNSLDPVAVKSIMGHVDSSMSGVYRQLVPDDRLQKVSDVVRNWFTGA